VVCVCQRESVCVCVLTRLELGSCKIADEGAYLILYIYILCVCVCVWCVCVSERERERLCV
jgi:hypothetical protein